MLFTPLMWKPFDWTDLPVYILRARLIERRRALGLQACEAIKRAGENNIKNVQISCSCSIIFQPVEISIRRVMAQL